MRKTEAIETTYEYRPTGSRKRKLEEMYSFLERCGIKTSFSSVVDFCIDVTYEGEYQWDAHMFEQAFKRYVAKRRKT